MSDPPSPWTRVLGLRAREHPDRAAYLFLADGEEEQGHLTCAVLEARARAVAAALSRSCRPGDRALLLHPPGLDFVTAFFGCLYAGVVAVPAYPPRSPRLMPRLQAILADARPEVVLAPAASRQRIHGWLDGMPEAAALSWLATDELDPAPDGWEPPAPDGDAVAFLQYTSGSTSTPKGVMVTQANLLHNQRMIQEACGHSEGSVFVTWLPPYHDLGLIGNLLQAAWVGAPCVLMAPVAFLQNPARWLRAVSRYRGTTSGGPNFAYDLCARRVPPAEIEKLDLSSWQVAFNGAEPVREETLARFAETFAPAGFRSTALYPCYGLAEATLMVSGGRPGEETVTGEIGARRLVGCGRALLDLQVAVVDPETRQPRPPGAVGEIWVAGGSVARGYWNRPEETAESFGATLADGRGPWLRTGDLGALEDGELFIAGRLKDLIILRGRNHYPQDLEATAGRAHPALGGGTGAAFAVDAGGEERLVVVHEVERHAARPEEIAAAVRQAIAEEHEALAYEVVLVPTGGVPRTTSGKVQRRACRDLYLQGELRVLGASRLSPAAAEEDPAEAPPGSLDWLRRAFAAAARVAPAEVDPDRPLSASGLDSLAAVEMKHAVEEATGVSLPLADLLEGMTLREVEGRVNDPHPLAPSPTLPHPPPGEGEPPPSGEHPLSWNQRSLWFLNRLAPESAAYNIAGAARVGVPPLPVGRECGWERGPGGEGLSHALQALVDRHPLLRATFAETPDGPVQRVAERAEVGFEVVDATGWSDEEIHARLHAEAFRPFDLSTGPLLRAALLRRGAEAFLVLAVHHIAADFWSMTVLAREMGLLYAADGDPRAAGLPALRVRSTDFVHRQEELLAGPQGEELQRWWRARLAGAPPLDLPSDRPRPAAASGRGTTRRARLAAGRLAGLQALAGERGATLFMALLAGLQALLARHSGQDDFLVGSPTSGRESALWTGAVGYFVNPVALRADLAGDPTGEELLARVRRTALDAFARADFPIALLPERLQPQAMLTLQKATAPELAPLAAFALGEAGARLSLGALVLESLALENPAAQRDLTLTAAETEGGLALSLQLDADLFDAATADRMLGHLGRLLEALAAGPGLPLSAYEILTGVERQQILAEWSGPGLRFPSAAPLHHRFAAQAARTPEAVAVSCAGHSLTYAELEARANRLARHLRRLGVGPEARVGLRAERSLGLVEGLLAILKAGGAYVPLDPRLPAGRLADLVADAGLRVLLTQEPPPMPLPPAVTVVGLDAGEGESSAPCADGAVDANAAYVIYTSGSTGRPKGVVVPHAAVARLLAATDPWFGFRADDVWTLFHSFAFDFSVWEIWGALLSGGRLVVVPYEVSRSPDAFYDLLVREGVTVLNQTPSAFRQLIAAEGRLREPRELALREVIFGGEALEPASLLPWFERREPGAGPRLVNMYGITETTVHVTFRPVTAADAAAAASPLGVPIPDLRVWLLDRHGAPVPALVAGEIHVGGDGLARGYLNRPGLTAERFVPDLWSGRPGARLYRSGDLARWRPDGGLEYLGRIDDQVKIRGFRIEPGEIQAALAAHPEVRESVVLARAAGGGEQRLAAWVVPAPGASPAAVELRRFLRERLPDYMVPADFAFLESLPLTANGKVDRRALPEPDVSPTVHHRASTPPADPVEEVLAGIWADLLQVGRVGREDDFFALGGDSLRATRVAARLRDAFDVELPLAALFAQTTLADLAGKIRQVRRAAEGLPGSRVTPAPRGGALPLSFAQESLWFLDRLAPGVPVYHLPAAVRLRGPLDPALLAAALTTIAERHEALRTVFAQADGRPVQVVLPPEPVPLPLVEAGTEEEAWRIAAAAAVRPFDLERGPLLRALLVRSAPEEHLLVLVLHHTVADGWSVSLFLRELEALYAGQPERLPELPVQYADYAVWQRRRMTDAGLAGQLSWWRERLADAPPLLELPTDRPRRAVPTFRGTAHPVRLPADLATALRELARRQGGTLFMALLAGFAALLHRSSGQDDLVIGAPFANRPRPELEPLVGFFVSSLPLCARLANDPGAAELLARLRAETLGASEHRDLPVERLIEELRRPRDAAASPLFQAMLAVEDGAPEPPVLPGCTAEIVPLGTGTAKLDLTLALAASGAELAGELEVSADLFEPATAERLLGHFTALLRGLVEDPGRPVSQLPLLAAAEREELLRQADGGAPRGGDACLHALVLDRAARSPEPVAVESAGESLTYRELRERATALAAHLQAMGVGPDVPVGLCADRTPSLVVGVLGILCAGGAWLPLDPELPRERRRSLLAEAGAPCVVTDARHASDWADLPVSVLPPGQALTGRPWIPPPVTPGHLACILSTSGSTGRPKLVALPHRGLVNRLRATVEAFGVGPGDAILQRTSIGFDVSVSEMFTALLSGARLVQVPQGDQRDPAALRRLARERGITFLDFVPSLLATFLEGAGPLPALRGVFVGGEALPAALAERCAAVLGRAPVNMYGPTEASIDVLWHAWHPGDASRATVPLGRPLAGCTVAVLDRHLEPAPAGVPGELWIGGACLARGYLGRPDLTAERFLPDPAAAEPGARLYRTGDLARRLADGEIEFLGRVDHQVKIRGVRVEPAEVEAALRALEGVREAAVVAVGAASGRRLAAYVVPADPAAPPRSLRAALARVLPEALIPSSFTLLPELPRTPGGKLDRRALPAPERETAAERTAPRTPVEARLAALWATLLGVPEVGVEESFFELGGHSLLAAQVVSRVRAELGVELPVRALFEGPTVAALAAAVEVAAGAPEPPLVPRPPGVEAPLSPAQERLWFLDRLEPGNPAYNVPLAFRLRGPVPAPDLAAALTALAARHEVLRATFAESAGRPVQAIAAEARFPLAVIDPGSEDLRDLLAAEARRPFDLAAGPLCRAALLRLDAADHLLVIVVHHIAFDGWSAGVLLRELELLASGTELPPLPVQYADFALWQNAWLDSSALAAKLDAWRARLAGAPAALDLPTDRRRPPVQTFRGGAEPVRLPAELVRGLRAVGRDRGATLFMTVLAGWSALLHRASGAPEVVVGTPVANRRRPELEGLIGLFVNTLPLRVGLAGDPPFAELVDRVRAATLAAFESQEVPFERLVEAVGAERDLSRSPLFQVMLALADGAPPVLRLPGVTAEEVPLHNGTAKFELLLALQEEADGGLSGGLEFNVDLFDAATAQRLLDRLARLLAGAAAGPRLRVGDLPLLAPAEERQLLVEWNATAAPFPRDLGLHELFQAQAARTPHADALVHGERRVTYAELAAWAGRLARRLRALGVGPERLVGVFCGRTPGMVAAALAVLEAGGAYLPLDPAYPADRLSFLLQDAGASVVLVERSVAAALPPFPGTLVPVEDEPGGPEADEAPRGFVHPEQAAYAIYTSGSTGTPKGVIVRHGSAVNRIVWAVSAYPPDVLSGVLAATSLCFDLSVFEIFAPLAAGGTVLLADDALALPGLPAAAEVTLVNTVPSAMTELVRSGALPRSVRVVNLAGEPLRRELAARLHAQGVEEVHNLYGPSEDTTYSTGALVERGDDREPAIGRPLPNTRAYVLDAGFRPVPVGAPGELWLGGEGVARGYLRRPDLTADRFRPDPFGSSPGGRLYRTGDLARWRADGALDFLGRLDHQVKVRGFRIEPGEIEAVLAAHPAISACAVVVQEQGDDRRLVAWLAAHGAAPAPAELRAWLAARLPSSMVPAVFAPLDALPLTPNGKVDRRALARLEPLREERSGGAPPATPLESRLAAIWSEVLGRAGIGRDDHFFTLGGHSLLATRVVSRLREELGVELPLVALFESPTLAELAQAVERARQAGAAAADGPIPAAGEGAALLSFAQERLWFLDQLRPGGAAYNIPAAVRLTGALDPAVLAAGFGEVLRRHATLRTTVAAVEGEPRPRVAPPAAVRLPVVDLAALPEEIRRPEALRLASAEAATPFDLAAGPLLRTTLLRLAADEHLFLLTLHHIVADGWSLGLLVRETAALYEAFAAGLPSPLPEPPLQYADFAAWQRRRLAGALLAGETGFWAERLRGAPAELALPTDRPRPAASTGRGVQRSLRLPAATTDALRALALRSGATPFMLLLAAFQVLLARLSGQSDLTVGTPVAGRERAEVEGLIGLFVNTLVLRAGLADNPSFADLLARTRRHALEAFGHQELPFEKLVEELQPGRHLGHMPLFQVLFVLQNAPAGPLRLPGLAVELVPVENGTAKLDLTLTLAEEAGGLAGELSGSADLFEGATLERWAGCFGQLLAAALQAPAQRIADLPLLSDAEQRAIVAAWSPSAAPAEPASLLARIEAWADRTPLAPAVVGEDGTLTWGELDARANHLAWRLRALGAGPGAPVALCLPRSAALVASLLGVLKAGSPYVPLDPDLPPARLAGLLADCGAVALITTGPLGALFPADGPPRLAPAAAGSPERPAHAAHPEDPAYVIYTSGSTGRPKGVVVEHRQLAAYVDGLLERTGLPAGLRYATVSTFAADLGHTAVFASLATGGALLVPARDLLTDPERLAAHLEEHPVDVLKIVPSHLAALLGAERPGRVLPRRLLVLGGEAAPWSLLERIRELAPACRVLNHYGPTETTVGVLTFPTWEADGRRAATVPLGHPLPGVRAVLVDAGLRPLPPGVPGELLVGGRQVSRGYLGRPDLTAERFVPDPFGARGERLYRTGDRARIVPGLGGGALEFLGRIDEQLKIRGIRIEPGEVEATLRACPELRAAAVAARRAPDGEPRLVAWVVPAADAPADLAAALRGALRQRLPEALIPAVFVPLPALPLTANGKLDRRALPEPVLAGAAQDGGDDAPRTPAEEVVAAVFAELLGVPRVGRGAEFFALGGHSLLAMRAVSRLRRAFGAEVEVRTLFESPTVAGLAARLERELRTGGSPLPPLTAEPRSGEPAPLSFAQERLWFLARLDPGSTAYNVPRAVDLAGELGPDRRRILAASLDEIVRRHEVLRTVFAADDGAPVQIVRPFAPRPLPLVDLSGLPAARRREEADRWTAEESLRPFDLAAAPPWRQALLRLEEDRHRLLLTLHHIASDGWSAHLLLRELEALWSAWTAGRPSPLPELPVQYADFARWQRRWLTGEALEAPLAWWRQRLEGLPELELPADRPRPAVSGGRAAVSERLLPPSLCDGLTGLARRDGATVFMVLLAGLQALLARHGGPPDLAVASPVANRQPPEVEPLLGFFVNTVILRTDLGGDPPFREVLARARETALGAYAHQEVPFERIVEEVLPCRAGGESPFLRVVLAFERATAGAPDLAGLAVTPLDVPPGMAKFDLTLAVRHSEAEVLAALEYRRNLFDGATAARLLERLEILLTGAAARPETRLAELPLLGAGEWDQILAAAAAPSGAPLDVPLHLLFAEVAAREPGRIALCGPEGEVTYAELESRANRLAHHLRALGAGGESLVGVALPRSAASVTAFLAILKAGGAYVPLDSSHPPARRAALIRDLGLPLLVTEERGLDDLLAAGAPVSRAVCLDRDAAAIAARPSCAPDPAGSADGLAYVLFTSGSTGRPKPVGVPHRAVVRLVRGAHYADFGPGETFLHLAPASFDAATLEIWGPLLHGGRLALLPAATPSLEEIAAVLEAQRVTTLWLTAGLFHEMVAHRIDALRGLRQLLAGGDVLSPEAVHRVLAELPGCRMINGYGPTENTTFTCTFTVRSPLPPGASVPIGRPVSNTMVYVLDDALRVVPDGVPGELLTGGDGLARGYLGAPDLTAERFVPSPFAGSADPPGARLYRTGDRVRRRRDGEIEFLGRRDRQVKIRGFRIEPGEIEAALLALPAVRQAAVEVRERAEGKALVAYVAAAEPLPTAAGLRELLRRHLPEHMIPAFFVALPALPLTANGKLDRKALPEPEGPPPGESALAPRTPVEELLTGIWAEVLGRERVGVHESFFELGGHSLLATRVVTRLRSVLGVEIPLRALFERPTVAELGAAVEEAQRSGAERVAPPLAPVPREGPLPLSFAQQRLWFIDQLTPGSPLYNIPVALRITGPLDAGVLALALGEIVGRHEALRTVFPVQAGAPVQWVRPAAPFVLPLVDLSALPEDRREPQALALAGEEARRPFDLARGPLLRGLLLRLSPAEGPGDHAIALTLHHIVSDGWSMGILVHEVMALYAAFADGRPSPLPGLAVQYGDFAAWQRSWLQGEVLEEEISYWRRQLAGLPPLLELPTDRPRPSVQSFHGASRPVRLPAGLARQMEALGRREGATLFMVLLAGFQALLARSSNQQDLAVGSPVAGRNRVEIEGLIGFFVNTLVLRGDLTGDATFRELLRRARETALAAYRHQDVPFEKLVQELTPERNLAHTPLFQVMLTLQNAPLRPFELPGLTAGFLAVETGSAKFDLVLALQETGGTLAGTLEFNAGLFDPTTVERLLGHLLRLYEAAAAEPDLRLSALPLLSPQERQQLLVEGRALEGSGPRAAGLHHLFEQQVERRPDAVALVCRGASLTYRELDREANRLAHLLIAHGAGPEVRVGLCLERSLEMVVGILAALKAGGAYVPLDPHLPAERLLFQLEDAGVAVLVTQASCRAKVSTWEGPLVCLDEGALRGGPDARPAGLTASGDALAYVLYTSGSTGRPKGVAVTHADVVRLLEVTREPFGFSAQDTWTLFHSYAFDFSVWELWGALAHGGRVVVVPQDVARSPEDFFRLLRAERVTVLNQTPSAFRQLAPVWSAAAGEPPPVRWVIFGGEALELQALAAWLAGGGPRPRLVNMYGITETTVHVTLRPVRAEDAAGPARSLIGGPLADLELYVAGRGLTAQPLGVPGELCVGGEGLARGYWRRPELTAERFVPDPWSGRPGARLYRSGDLGRRLPDGDLEYLGRIDHQVKIRGLRIELGEIEATLARHPAVRASVVQAVDRPGVAGDRRLAAWVAVDPAARIGAAELRAFLGERLADYMVPATFVLMDALPLTPNGKVDRAALPVAEGSRPELEVSFVAPRTREELAVAAVWQEVLAVERVGVYDNFFDLGGHSLLMVQVQSRLRDALSREIAVLDLFQHPTVGALARHLGTGEEEAAEPAAILASESRGESRRARAAGQQLQRQRRRTGRSGDFET